MPVLRPYQDEGEDEIRDHYAKGSRAVLYVLPTGGGKTFLFVDIARKAAAKKKRVLILVHRQELLYQASLSLAALGVYHGIIAQPKQVNTIVNKHMEDIGANYLDQKAAIQVASVQTFARPQRLAKYAHLFHLIIIDEAHHAVAGQWKRSIEAAHHARILGVTATPMRLDGQGLGVAGGGVFNSMVKGPSIAELIDQGYLCKPEVYAPPNDLNMKGVRKNNGDYSKKETVKRYRESCVVGDAVDHYKRLVPGKPAIAFCPSVEDAEMAAARFRQKGIVSTSISGDTPDQERARAIAGLANGQVKVLTSCDIVSEGTDIPAVEAAILLRPTDSEALYLQQVGRALRTSPGKEKAIILDHVGNCLRFGLPDEDRIWSLEGASKDHRPGYSSGNLQVRQCPKCFAAHSPNPRCPKCGHIYEVLQREVEQVDGELRKIEAAEAEKMKIQRRQEIAMANDYESLAKLAEERGYKKGWIHQMREVKKKQGKWKETPKEAAKA